MTFIILAAPPAGNDTWRPFISSVWWYCECCEGKRVDNVFNEVRVTWTLNYRYRLPFIIVILIVIYEVKKEIKYSLFCSLWGNYI